MIKVGEVFSYSENTLYQLLKELIIIESKTERREKGKEGEGGEKKKNESIMGSERCLSESKHFLFKPDDQKLITKAYLKKSRCGSVQLQSLPFLSGRGSRNKRISLKRIGQ